jgi:isoquinoline 1-oxidoreductase alpha subunit
VIEFSLNGQPQRLDVEANMPLLWVLRDELQLTGTKFGCGMGLCGACTVHLNGQPIRACITPLGSIAGQQITTIEGLPGDASSPIQQAWLAHNVPQCGYCQSGQIMSASALLANTPNPTDTQIDQAMAGNLCRCGTYPRIKAAIKTAAQHHSTNPAQSASHAVQHYPANLTSTPAPRFTEGNQ